MKVHIGRLPDKPGVYLLKNKKGRVIYIGKSINIQSRVRTHLKSRSPFVHQIADADYFVTANEPEALIKESELIKKYLPRYNIMLRDDKQYFYTGFSQDKLPILSITHRPPRGAVGPFTDGKSLRTVLRYLRRAFPYYSQKHRHLPCSYCHLGLCPGPNPDKREYKKNIAKIKAILNGKKPRVLSNLKKEMARFAKGLEFENAGKARDQWAALENIFAHKVRGERFDSIAGEDKTFLLGNISTLEAYDISNIQGREPVASMVRFDNGKPNKSMYRRFRIRLPEKPDDYAMMREVIARRLAHTEWPYPDVFLIDGGRGQLNAALLEMQKAIPLPTDTTTGRLTKEGSPPKVVALAKRFNELYVPGLKRPIPLSELPEQTKNLLMYARDEAHRFAISYHRQLHRRKNML